MHARERVSPGRHGQERPDKGVSPLRSRMLTSTSSSEVVDEAYQASACSDSSTDGVSTCQRLGHDLGERMTGAIVVLVGMRDLEPERAWRERYLSGRKTSTCRESASCGGSMVQRPRPSHAPYRVDGPRCAAQPVLRGTPSLEILGVLRCSSARGSHRCPSTRRAQSD